MENRSNDGNLITGPYKYTLFELYDLRVFTLRTIEQDTKNAPINSYCWTDSKCEGDTNGPFPTLWECMKNYTIVVEFRKTMSEPRKQEEKAPSNVIHVDFNQRRRL